jgi:putative restriction endonuclease
MKFWVGTTDPDWFRYLPIRSFDEVNFWQPTAGVPFKTTDVGMPFLFKLKKPYNHIAGGGFFVGHSAIPFGLAWDIFGNKNGADSLRDLQRRLASLTRSSSDTLHSIGCQIIANPVFLPSGEWLPDPPGWSPNIVRGKMYDTRTEDGAFIWSWMSEHLGASRGTLVSEVIDAELAPNLTGAPLHKYGDERLMRPRLGQGAFRLMLTDLYKRRCAITAESTLPVLEAAHIVPYAELGTHNLRNGLLLRADFHKLFDTGLVGVTPQMTVKVSPRIREAWFNGKAYYRLDDQPLAVLPDDPASWPDPDLLDWHIHNVFQH